MSLTPPPPWPPPEPGIGSIPLAATPGPAPLPAQPRINGLAIASLVLAILGILAYWVIGSVAAIITGHVALSQIARTDPPESGRGLALGGLITGYASLALELLVLAFIVAMLVTAS